MISESSCEVSGHRDRVLGHKDKLKSVVQVEEPLATNVEHNHLALRLMREIAAAAVRLWGL